MTNVSIGRDSVEVKLFDTKGGIVKLYTALTVQEQTDILKAYEGKEDPESKTAVALETIVKCFQSWNIGTDTETMPCSQETLKKFTQRDLFAMLQVVTGRPLLDEQGNILTPEQSAKKGSIA